jgi:hypothetical protein
LSLLVLPVVQEFDGDQRLLLTPLVDASALLNILLLCKKCCSPLQFAAADDDDAIIVFLGVKSLNLSFRVHLSYEKRIAHLCAGFL